MPLDYPPANSGTQQSCWWSTEQPGPGQLIRHDGGAPFYVPAVQFNTDEPTAIVSSPSTTFTQGVDYNFTVLANAYPDPTWSVSSGLPTGVSLTPAPPTTATTGTLSGATCQTGSFPVTITADSSVTGSASQPFDLTVVPSAITTTDATGFTQTRYGSTS